MINNDEKMLEHIKKTLQDILIDDYTPEEIEQRNNFYDYVNKQYAFINKLAVIDMDKAQLLLSRLQNMIGLYI